MKTKATQIGLVLGSVFIIMGFAYGNKGVWMLGLIFLAIAIPSWVPRLAYYGNPLHNGVVGNAMWVDTWEELRANQNEPLGPSYYFASHGLSEVVERFRYGFEAVYLTAPQHYTPRIHLLAAAGLLVAALRRRRRDLVLIATAFLTLLPITWTSLPMPFTRIAYGAQLAFILLFSAILLEFMRDLAVRAIPGSGATFDPATGRRRLKRRVFSGLPDETPGLPIESEDPLECYWGLSFFRVMAEPAR